MKQGDSENEEWSEQQDYYMSQSRALVKMYLLDHGITSEELKSMPKEQAQVLLKQAWDYAADQIARIDILINLGNPDGEEKMDAQPRRRYGDRMDRYFKSYNKS